MHAKNEISDVGRSKKDAKKTYNQISRWYDLFEGRWEKDAMKLGIKELDIKGDAQVLEIGPGTGHALLDFASSISDKGGICGIDISIKMLQIDRKRLIQANLYKKSELILGDGALLPFKNEAFDAIFMSFVLELFDTQEIPKVMAECSRVLRREGQICVLSLSKEGGSNLMVWLYEWLHGLFPKILDCRPIYVHEIIEGARFDIQKKIFISLWGLPAEIVLGKKL
jgi:ubiquinone/menaquinone biosynthesis C-methylase UbiE